MGNGNKIKEGQKAIGALRQEDGAAVAESTRQLPETLAFRRKCARKMGGVKLHRVLFNYENFHLNNNHYLDLFYTLTVIHSLH